MEGVQDDVGGLVLGRKRASVDVFDFLKFILMKEGQREGTRRFLSLCLTSSVVEPL